MPRVRTQRRRSRRRTPSARRNTVAVHVAPTVEAKPVRGMKLKTVSRLTMLFALLCLAAFVAGRPPASEAGSGMEIGKEPKPLLSQGGYLRPEPVPVRMPIHSPQAN